LFIVATPHSMQLHGSISYGDSVSDAGKMHFRHSDQQNSSGGGPRPPPAWASQLRCSQGRAPHDMVCPQAKNPSYAPAYGHALLQWLKLIVPKTARSTYIHVYVKHFVYASSGTILLLLIVQKMHIVPYLTTYLKYITKVHYTNIQETSYQLAR